jgi:hypothetical protein
VVHHQIAACVRTCACASRYYNGAGCCDPGSGSCSSGTTPKQCASVYHSCTVPLKITGSTPRADLVCPGQPDDWPDTWEGTSAGGAAQSVSVTVGGVYRQESSATWTDGSLLGAPLRYRQNEGLCATDLVRACAPAAVLVFLCQSVSSCSVSGGGGRVSSTYY